MIRSNKFCWVSLSNEMIWIFGMWLKVGLRGGGLCGGVEWKRHCGLLIVGRMTFLFHHMMSVFKALSQDQP